MKKLHSAAIATELDILQATLEAAGIECTIQNRFPPAAGDVPPIVAWPSLWILDDARLAEAQGILQDFLREQAAISEQPSWVCAQCGAEVNAELAICWQCGKECNIAR